MLDFGRGGAVELLISRAREIEGNYNRHTIRIFETDSLSWAVFERRLLRSSSCGRVRSVNSMELTMRGAVSM